METLYTCSEEEPPLKLPLTWRHVDGGGAVEQHWVRTCVTKHPTCIHALNLARPCPSTWALTLKRWIDPYCPLSGVERNNIQLR